MRSKAAGCDREQLDAHLFGQRRLVDFGPQFVEVEQALGDEEGDDDLAERGTLLLGQVEGKAWPEPIDEAVCSLGAENFMTQAVRPDCLCVRLAHRFREGV